jgi:6-phosphogluconolactonase
MHGEAEDLEAAARDYSEQLPPALDLIILGVGDDGHVCSLFPGHPALQVENARAIAIYDSPKPPPRRLTLTLNYVLRSRAVWIVAVGPKKEPILQNAVARQHARAPIDLVVSQGRDVTIFTDQQIKTPAPSR